LGGRKGIQPVKKLSGGVLAWCRGADLHMAQLMALPLTISCFSKIQIGFTFLVPAHPSSPRKKAVKRVCVSFMFSLYVVINNKKIINIYKKINTKKLKQKKSCTTFFFPFRFIPFFIIQMIIIIITTNIVVVIIIGSIVNIVVSVGAVVVPGDVIDHVIVMAAAGVLVT